MLNMRKIRKLLRDPLLFCKDSKNPALKKLGGFLKPVDRTSIKEGVETRPIDNLHVENGEPDLWLAYKRSRYLIPPSMTSQLVVALLPIGVPSFDIKRAERLESDATPLFLPIWDYFSAGHDIDDINFRLKKSPKLLGPLVRDLLAWALTNGVSVLAVAGHSTPLLRAVTAKARLLNMTVVSDFNFCVRPDSADFDLYLTTPRVNVFDSTRKDERSARALAGIGGLDTIRLLILPWSAFGLGKALISQVLAEQVRVALLACEPTDHLVVLMRRRDNGFINNDTFALIAKKYRSTVLFYDESFDFDALVKGAEWVLAPSVISIDQYEKSEHVLHYVVGELPHGVPFDSQSADSLAEVTAFRHRALWNGAPFDERESVLRRIIEGPELSTIAVPDPLTNLSVTSGRQRYLETLLNARARCYGGEPGSVFADLFVQWGAEPNEPRERQEVWRAQTGTPRLYLEDGFIRSLGLWTDPDEPTYSIVMDTRAIYYDSTKPSLLETILESSYQLATHEFTRARGLIDKIVRHRISKYNYAPVLELNFRSPDRRSILLVDQKVGDLSIKYGCASEASFRAMLDDALALGDNVEIIIKQHPCAINAGDGQAHFSSSSLGAAARFPNVHLVNFDINPYSLIEAVDEVWVVSSGMGFEALLAGKPVRCFGLPFYSGWGLTHDTISCPRRTRRRKIEEVFHVFYIMLSRYIDPRTAMVAPIERLIAYFIERTFQRH